jgi:hypothetical protein
MLGSFLQLNHSRFIQRSFHLLSYLLIRYYVWSQGKSQLLFIKKFWEHLVLSLTEIIQGVSEIGSHINTHENNSCFRHQWQCSCDTFHKSFSKCPSCTLQHDIAISIFWHLKWSTKKASAQDTCLNEVSVLFWSTKHVSNIWPSISETSCLFLIF